MEKVLFVYHDDEGGIGIENVWAEKQNEHFIVKNVPFFAPNIAYGDLISVEIDGGELYYLDLIKASGHSTVQVIFLDGNEVENTLKALQELGCDWEQSHLPDYYAIDVPAKVDYQLVKKLFKRAFQSTILDYKEACLSEQHR